MTRLTLILLTISLTVWGQDSTNGLVGLYASTANKFERHSILILDKGNRFTYKYGVGGCQGEVKGSWTIENKLLKFTNDKEFLNDSIKVYPNLGLTTWTIKKLGIKPNGTVDSGCVKEDALHLKKK